MGFQDVRENHGTSEKGKDIVMWKHSDLDSRIDYAVVVKATKIFALTEAGHHDMPKEIFGNVLLLENEIIRRGSLLLRHVEGKRPP